MKSLLSILTLGALLAAPAVLSAKITRTVDKTFTVQPGGNLKAVTQGGDITIRTADTPEVRIHVKQVIHASFSLEAWITCLTWMRTSGVSAVRIVISPPWVTALRLPPGCTVKVLSTVRVILAESTAGAANRAPRVRIESRDFIGLCPLITRPPAKSYPFLQA